LRHDESHYFLSFLPPSLSAMEFVHKADSHRCCVKGCARHATRPVPNAYTGELLQFGHHKQHILCDSHHVAVLRAMKVFFSSLVTFLFTLKDIDHNQQAHHHDHHDIVHHAKVDSEQHLHAHPLKPFSDLGGHQQWTRVNDFAINIWKTIVDAAMNILHCESFDLEGIRFAVDGLHYAIEFSHERHSMSHLSIISEEERSQIFMVSKKLTGQTIVNKRT